MDVEDLCPLCPPSGPAAPPKRAGASRNPIADADDGPALIWISCSRCSKWFHSACILMADEKVRETVPIEAREEVEKNHRDEGVWTNWVNWIDKWYCVGCVQWSADPDTPLPPRHPRLPTLKRSFVPNSKLKRHSSVNGRKSLKRLPNATTVDHHPSGPVKKRTKRESAGLSEARSEGSSVDQSNGHLPLNGDSTAYERDTSINNTHPLSIGSAMINGEAPAEGSQRPKRQVALNRPDYHALHHHIATPTSKWLDLISDPEKYGKTIKEDGFPRLPGHLVTRAWIESASSSQSHVIPPTHIASTSRPPSPLSPPPSDTSQPAYPPHLPPTLFYGSHREPLIIGPEDGGFESLGGKLPSKDLTVNEITQLVGPDRMVDVIDVATQQSYPWSLSKWADSIATRSRPPDPGSSAANKVYNVISLEITGTELAKRVRPPQLVRDIDWVDNFWHFGPGGKVGDAEALKEDVRHETNGKLDENGEKGKAKAEWPKVQLYCLMGMRGSWTDWHIDFAASSVYYTVHTGAKTFFFIRPTEKNLAAYAEWSGSYEKQQSEWLGDMCDEVRKVTLRAGDTMIIPSGYIHAVYTPVDSIVFGGNFLHSYDIPTQLRLRQIEIDTKVPQRFRFPYFDRLCWYVADHYCANLRQFRAYRPRAQSTPPSLPPICILEGLRYLAAFLLSQVAILEDHEAEDKRRKAIYDKIPSDVVRDPAGLAKELEWRVLRELPKESIEDDLGWDGEKYLNGKRKPLPAIKKKPRGMMMLPPVSRTWHFEPAPWAQQNHSPGEMITIINKTRPNTGTKPRFGSPEKATKTETTYHQIRSRESELDDGRVILEEQDVKFTETRYEWGPLRKMTPRAENGDGEAVLNGVDDRMNGVDL